MQRKSLATVILTAIGAMLLFLPSSAIGQGAPQPPDTLPGFSIYGLYENGGIDNVSPYNGSPNILVPLGPSYSLGPGYKWQLRSYYSSMFWHLDDPDSACGDQYPHARILGYPALGAGWRLELGFVYAPGNNFPGNGVTYVSPDGAQHKVVLPEGTASAITTDGSRLRITRTPASGTVTKYTVEFPDGTKGVYDHGYYNPTNVAGTSPDFIDQDPGEIVAPALRMGLTSLVNPFPTPSTPTTLLSVAYVSNVQTSPDAWRVSSITLTPASNSRTINYHWKSVQITDSNNGSPTWLVLDYISFPVFGGATFNATFGYYSGTDSNIYPWPRNPYDHSGPGCTSPATVAVPLLASISSLTDPTGVTSQYSFAYNSTHDTDDGIRSRALKDLTLPSSGTIHYDYSPFTPCYTNCVDPDTHEPIPDLPVPETPDSVCRSAHGKVPLVIDRIQTDPATGVSSTVSFDRYQYGPIKNPVTCDYDDAHVARRVIVTKPSGNGSGTLKTRFIFHVDYGDADGIEIEERFYAENADPNTATPIRSIINCWNGDSVPAEANAICGLKLLSGDPPQDYPIGHNVRQQASVVWYGLNPYPGGACPTSGSPVCTKAANTTWDAGALRFETTTVTSTVSPWTSSNSRVTTTDWAPQTGASFWSLDLFNSKTQTDAGTGTASPTTVTTSYSFNTTNGFLNSYGTTDSSYGTVTHTFTDDGSGNPGTEQMTASGSGMTTAGFTDTRTFANGALKTTQRSGIGWKSTDTDLDANTRLLQTSRDPNASLATTYVYDALGRVTSTSRPGEGLETQCYLNAVGVYPPFSISKKGSTAALACRKDDGAGPWTSTMEGYQYDGFGRVIREIRRFPNLIGNTFFARRERRYDAAGHLVLLSEWYGCPKDPSYATTDISNCAKPMPVGTFNGNVMTWSTFDPFGRPGVVAQPDGDSTSIAYTDGSVAFSDNKKTVTVNRINGSQSAVTIFTRDPLGRLTSVQEPDVAGESNVTTNYKYDVLDQLAEVSQPGAGTTSGTTQTRTLTHDKLGLLRVEKIPEKWSGSAPVSNTYDKYDALGDLKQKTEGSGASQVVSTYTYDNAGRLLQVEAPAGTKYLVNCYDGVTTCDGVTGVPAGGTNPKGHKTRAVGYNYIPTYGPQLIEDYTYSDSAGSPRLSATATTAGNGDLTWSSTQSWTYNGLGVAATRKHPRTTGGTGSMVETVTYSTGRTTKITANVDGGTATDVVKGVTYNPAGGIATWQAGNNVVTTITQDGYQMPRPQRIATSGVVGGDFDTGTIFYDGDGNITQMGSSDLFVYDLRSRLTSATLSGFTARTFTYDRFGNITNLGGQSGQTNFTVDARNNHLTSGGASFDTRGNMTAYGPVYLTFDNINRFTRNNVVGSVDFNYLFDADGERALKFQGYGNLVKRRELARFVAEANIKSGKPGWTLPQTCSQIFNDVPCSDADALYIQLVSNKGVTAGCSITPPLFCPEDTITRGQMAVFLVKGYEPEPVQIPACTGTVFPVDVPCTGGTFDPWIEELGRDQVAAGCGSGMFCPNSTVGEWEMMVWLSKVPGTDSTGTQWGANYHPVPRGTTYTLRDEQARIMTEAIGGGTPTSVGDYGKLFPSRDNVYLGNLLVASYVSPIPSIINTGTGWFYYHSDQLGTPRWVTDSSANKVEQRKYWPYGEEVNTTTMTNQNLRFSLMERDPEANHYYDHSRSQDFSSGRFFQPDALFGKAEAPWTFNRYSYGADNPLKYIDPNGHQASAVGFGLLYQDPRAAQAVQDLPQAFAYEVLPAVAVGSFAATGSIAWAGALGGDPLVNIGSLLLDAAIGNASAKSNPAEGTAIGALVDLAVNTFLPGPEVTFFRGLASSLASQWASQGNVSVQTTAEAAIIAMAAQLEVGVAVEVGGNEAIQAAIEGLNAIIEFLAGFGECDKDCDTPPPHTK